MKKILGILGLLIFVCLVTHLWTPRFATTDNIENVMRRTALFGIISIGAGFVIMTSGIDLSIGSVVCLVGCLFPYFLVEQELPLPVVLLIMAGIAILAGLIHGLLITKLKLQPFIVTLCGLLIYRGLTRGITQDQTQGFKGQFAGLRELTTGSIPLPGIEFSIPNACIILLVIMALAIVFLNYTVYGQYLLALGRNEDAARMSGINSDRMIIFAYVICAVLSGLGGVLFVFDVGSAQPSDFGNFYELYAIAAAVLGGCSLRGGEGSIVGIVIGAAVMQLLRNSIVLIDEIPSRVEFAVIGIVILGGVIVDELGKRVAANRRLKQRLNRASA